MNQNADIQHIRRLVEKFYQGATTPAEDIVLAEFFRHTPPADIPDDIAADAHVFGCLNALEVVSAPVPPGLEARIDEITSTGPTCETPRARRFWPAVLKVSAAVAAACLIWGLFALYGAKDGEPTLPQNADPLVAEATDNTEVEMPDSDVSDDAVVPAVLDNVQQERRATRHIAHAQPPATLAPAEIVSDAFTEVTDPQEARRIMEDVCNLLAANFGKSDKAINTVSASFQSYNEITKTILQ